MDYLRAGDAGETALLKQGLFGALVNPSSYRPPSLFTSPPPFDHTLLTPCLWPWQLCNRIAVAAADRSVTFYDLFTIEVACRVRNLKHAPTAMAYHVSGTHSKVQFLTLGDDSGKIHVFKLKPHFYFREGLDETGNEAFSYWKRKSEKLEKQGLLEYYTQQLHSDWITKCIYIADIQPSILTCSLDMTVKFFNVEKKIFEREFEGHRDNKEGVQALLYIKAVKCMASCGVGRTIITWNPHTCEKNSGATLRGHVAPVTHLATDDVNSRLISVSMDKVIKFWDTSTWRCMQVSRRELSDARPAKNDNAGAPFMNDRAGAPIVHACVWSTHSCS